MEWQFLGLLYNIFGAFLIVAGLLLSGPKYRFDAEIGFAFMIVGFFLQMTGALGIPSGGFFFLALHFYLPAALALYVLLRMLEEDVTKAFDQLLQKYSKS